MPRAKRDLVLVSVWLPRDTVQYIAGTAKELRTTQAEVHRRLLKGGVVAASFVDGILEQEDM